MEGDYTIYTDVDFIITSYLISRICCIIHTSFCTLCWGPTGYNSAVFW